MSLDGSLLRKVMGEFATGVAVATTTGQGGRHYGVTVNSFTSVSLDPPLILICLDHQVSGLDHFEESGRFGINILSFDQHDASLLFSTPTQDRSRYRYRTGPNGIVLLEKAMACLECELEASYPGGDHRILLAKVLSAEASQDDAPLIFFRGAFHRLPEGGD